MERISIQDLASLLSTKSGLKKKDAERFVTIAFEVVKSGLTAERLVKIKGLGTFKIVDIESRESVNVNTGERVLIEGHDKITFTPDSTLKELVNKPFSQFETVVLNDGVDFTGMESESVGIEISEPQEEVAAESPEMAAVEEETPEVTAVEEETSDVAAVEEETPEEAAIEEELPGMAAAVFDSGSSLIQDQEDTQVDDAYGAEKPRRQWRFPYGVAIAALLCLLSFGLGYYAGHSNWHINFSLLGGNLALEEIPYADLPEENNDKVDSIEESNVNKVDSAQQIRPKTETKPEKKREESSKPEKPVEPAKPQKPAAVSKQSEQPDYGKLDARVRLGAYNIIGTDYEVKVKAGETLSRISRRALGPDMDCYVEAYNGLKSNSPLKEGQVIKIPKLQVKKKMK